jgi:hypothetical protein
MALAISEGVITGKVLETYNTIRGGYEDANEVAGNLKGLGTAVEIAS